MITSNLKQRYLWIDTLRFFAIVLMVVGHSGAPAFLTKLIYGFHMPLFFVLSGWLYDDEKWHNRGFKVFIKKKVNSYLIPYVIWGAFNMLINSLFEIFRVNSFVEWIQLQLSHMFWLLYSYGDRTMFPNCTPLWFLPYLFWSSVLLYLFMRISNKWKRLFLIILTLALILNICLYTKIRFPMHIDIAIIGCFFMFLGYVINQYRFLLDKIQIYTLFFPLLLSSFIIYNNDKIDIQSYQFGIPLMFIIGALGVCLFVVSIFYKYQINNKYSYIFGGGNTIIFMAINYLLNTIYISLFNMIGLTMSWWLNSILVILTCSIIAYYWGNIINQVYEKFKWC